MPIYEYKCSKCGVFEAMQGIKEGPFRKCPTCKGKVERLISRGSFILKGSGWYATDYAKSKPSTAESDSSSSATTNGTAASSSDSSKSTSESTSTASSSSESKPSKSKSSEKSVAAKSAD